MLSVTLSFGRSAPIEDRLRDNTAVNTLAINPITSVTANL